MFHIFHRPPREFPSRIDPNAEFRARRYAHRKRIRNRRLGALAVVVALAAALTFGFQAISSSPKREAPDAAAPAAPKPAPAPASANPATDPPAAASRSKPMPDPVRGVHVSMPVIAANGLDGFLKMTKSGLNALVVEIKDEHGQVAFPDPAGALSRQLQSARGYYDPKQVVQDARASDVYLIGRIVVFRDPWLAERKPGLAIKHTNGGVWQTYQGAAWANPYDERVWRYNVDLAVEAAKAGFDEIMFDYVRFPSDGDLSAAVYPGKTAEPKAALVARFLKYARERIDGLGLGVKVSAAVFGLAATRDLGIGQNPRLMSRYLDAVHPMVYPSHYGANEYNIPDPGNAPGKVTAYALGDFARALRGRTTELVPWIQDFSLNGERDWTLRDVRAQVEAGEKRGAAGYLLWNPFVEYTRGALGLGG